MARRKKTPDVLAEQKPEAQQPAVAKEQKPEPSSDPSVHAPTSEEGKSSPNPYAALFPPRSVSHPSSSVARVKLEVTASQDIAGKVQHCMAQALGALPDLQLVQEGADWTLIVLGAPIQPPGGKMHGIALSAVAIKTYFQENRSRPKAEERTDVMSTTSSASACLFRGTWLRIGAVAQIQKLCEQLVNDFCRRYFTGQRTAL